MNSTLSAFVRVGEVDGELIAYSPHALELAFALLPDEELAFQIVLDAALNVRRHAQKKEHYRRYASGEKKTKILLNRVQLFQQMIWCEARKWEKYQETTHLLRYAHASETAGGAPCGVSVRALENELEASEIRQDAHLSSLISHLTALGFDENDLVVRYLGLLVQDASANHAAHTALSVGHLIYDDSLSLIADMCALLSPRATGGQYFYGLRAKVLRRVKERFRHFLTWSNGDTYDRFTPLPETETEWRTLITTWLQTFVPWKTTCPSCDPGTGSGSFAERLFQVLETIPDEDQKEATCVHTVLCPTCFAALRMEGLMVNRSKVDPPADQDPQLALPSFHVPSVPGEPTAGTSRTDRYRPTGFRAQGLFERRLVQEITNGGRETGGPNLPLLIFIDGKKYGELSPTQPVTPPLTLDGQARLVRVMAPHPEGLKLVGSLWLTEGGTFCIDLGGGTELFFQVVSSETAFGDIRHTLTVGCRPQTVLSWFERLLAALQNWKQPFGPPLPAPVLASAGLTLLVFGVAAVTWKTIHPAPKTNNTIVVSHEFYDPSRHYGAGPRTTRPQPDSGGSFGNPDLGNGAQTAGNGNRNPLVTSIQPSDIPLGRVKALALPAFGNDSSSQNLISALTQQLSHHDIAVTNDLTQADAILKCTWKDRGDRRFIEVVLANRPGETLFSREFAADGDLTNTATTIVATLTQAPAKP